MGHNALTIIVIRIRAAITSPPAQHSFIGKGATVFPSRSNIGGVIHVGHIQLAITVIPPTMYTVIIDGTAMINTSSNGHRMGQRIGVYITPAYGFGGLQSATNIAPQT